MYVPLKHFATSSLKCLLAHCAVCSHVHSEMLVSSVQVSVAMYIGLSNFQVTERIEAFNTQYSSSKATKDKVV